MTLPEVKRLVRGISDSLDAMPSAGQAGPRLAHEYAEICRKTAVRLEQCASMVEAADELQALQLAEASPPVLDLVAVLSFRQVKEWRDRCRQQGWAVAEPFDPRSIRLLNGVYGKGISSQHPLYREFRQAVLRQDDERALEKISLIAKLNPSDQNAQREMLRLQRKRLSRRLAQMEDALRREEPKTVLDLVGSMETEALPISEDDPVWREAQALRAECLLDEAKRLQEADQWGDAIEEIERIHRLRSQYDLTFDSEREALLQALQDWSERRLAEQAAEEQARRATLQLRRLVESTEEKLVAARGPTLLELRSGYDELTRKARDAELWRRSWPPELNARLEKCQRLLRARIGRRERARRRWLGLGVLVLAILAIIGINRVLSSRRADDWAERLEEAEHRREVTKAEQLVEEVRINHAGLLRWPAVGTQLAATESWLEEERVRKTRLLRLIEDLQRWLADGLEGVSPATAHKTLVEARALTSQLAPEVAASMRETVAAVEAEWAEVTTQLQPARRRHFSRSLEALQEMVRDLDYSSGPKAVGQQVAALEAAIVELDQPEFTQYDRLRVPDGLVHQLNEVKAQAAVYAEELHRWSEIQDRLSSAITLEEYRDALEELEDSPFLSRETALAAGRVVDLAFSSQDYVRFLLRWPGLEQAPPLPASTDLTLNPVEVMPAERALLAVLRDDPTIHDVQRAELVSLRSDQPPRQIFVRGSVETNRFGRIETTIYDPVESPAAIYFQAMEFPPSEKAVRLLGPSAASEVYEQVGLKKLVDPRTGVFTEGLLSILDRLNQFTQADPLFRAYLFVRLAEVLALRPESWGALWVPAVQLHLVRLQETIGNPQSGDWLVPVKVEQHEEVLGQFFDSFARASYVDQARFFHALFRRFSGEVLRFVGYVDAQGRPVLSTLVEEELWGLVEPDQCTRLFQFQGGRHVPLTPALPFSPLFVPALDRRHLLAEVERATGIRADGDSVRPFMPEFMVVE